MTITDIFHQVKLMSKFKDGIKKNNTASVLPKHN